MINQHKIIELTYNVHEITNSEHFVILTKKNDPESSPTLPTNDIRQASAFLIDQYGNQVGKIYYYSNSILQYFPEVENKFFENVVLELFPSCCFKPDSFVTGQLFYTSGTNIFKNNNKYSFNSLTNGGSFEDKRVKVIIETDNTPFRKVKIIIHDLETFN